MNVTALLLFALIGGVTATARHADGQDVPRPISIYVFTAVDAAESPTPVESERLEMVKNLKLALPNNKKISAQVSVSESKAPATITVEVLTAQKDERVIQLSNDTLVSPRYQSKAKLSFGDYSTDFLAVASQKSYRGSLRSGMDGPTSTLLRLDAMSTLVGKIHAWITDNLDDLRKK